MKTLLALILTALTAFAVDAPKVPAEVTGSEGSLITIPAEAKNGVKFKVIAGEGLVQVPQKDLVNQKQFVGFGKAGRYRVISWTADAGEPSDLAETLVIIAGSDNKIPVAKVPEAIQTAFNTESNPQKKELAVKLGAAYRDTAVSLEKGTPMTHGDVFTTGKSNRVRQIGDTLPLLRETCNETIANILSINDSTSLSETDRQAVIKQFRALAGFMDILGAK